MSSTMFTVVDTRLPLESEAQAMMSHFPDSCCFSMMLRYSYTALTVSGTYTDTVTSRNRTEGYLQQCTFPNIQAAIPHISGMHCRACQTAAHARKSMKIHRKSCESWCHRHEKIITAVSINSPSPSCHKSLRVGFLLDTTAASRLPGASTTTQWTPPLQGSTQVLLQVHPAFHHPLGVFTWKSVKKPQVVLIQESVLPWINLIYCEATIWKSLRT